MGDLQMKKLGEKIAYWAQILLLPIYGLSFLMPRNKRIWAFGSTFGRRFTDNPRFLYTYLHDHPEEGIRPIWFSHNREIINFLKQSHFEAYYYHSFKGIWYALRSKVFIFDNYSKDINFWQSGGAIKINLWHGTGNKRTNHDNEFDRFRHPHNLKERFLTFPRRLSDEKPHHYVLATSDTMATIFASAFNTSSEHVIIDGYPRNDIMLLAKSNILFQTQETRYWNEMNKKHQEGYRIDLYMPTFRASEEDFFKTMDLIQFNEFLIKEKIIFIVKLHPKSMLKEQFATLKYSNIWYIKEDVDPYTFLHFVDVLTTDYSSIYSDFMLLDRPVVAFHYDYERYTHETRDSYFPFDEYMPEPKATTMQELMDRTIQVLVEDKCREMRKLSRDKMWKFQDSNSSQRLTQKIKAICGL